MKILPYFRNLIKDFNKHKEKFLWKHFNKGRTQTNISIWKVNNVESQTSKHCPKLIEHLNSVHPKQWYDDELDALFFTICDYLLSKKIKVIIKKSRYDNRRYFMRMNSMCYDFVYKHEIIYFLLLLCEENSYLFK